MGQIMVHGFNIKKEESREISKDEMVKEEDKNN